MNVCASSHYCVHLMGLSPENEVLVEECIKKYTPPQGFTPFISYSVYRIWNAVKHVFNQSDWQITYRLILNNCRTTQIMTEHLRESVVSKSVQNFHDELVHCVFIKALDLNQDQTPYTESLRRDLRREYWIAFKLIVFLEDVLNAIGNRSRG